MNKIKSIICLPLALGLLTVAPSCNKADDYEQETYDYSVVAVKSFSLKNNNAVLHNLDSVFFTIDLNSAQVFNADSLPVGTKINEIKVNVTTSDCSSVKFLVPKEEGDTAEIDYGADADAKIDFSRGGVKLRLVAFDKKTTRDYSVKINVHKMVPDSLYWSEVGAYPLAGIKNPTAQKSVKMGNNAYCLTTDGTSYNMSVASDLYHGAWVDNAANLPKGAKVATLTASDDALYILSASNELLRSTDGLEWQGCGVTWEAITVGYGKSVVGLELKNGSLYHAIYPANGETLAKAEAGFPVSGNAGAVPFNSKWSQSPQVITVGGRTAAGALTGAVWAFDGHAWAQLSNSLPAAEGMAVTTYTVATTDSVSWRVNEKEVMLAFGGRSSEGNLRPVFLSVDMGLNWKPAGKLLQLPAYIPSLAGADLLVFSTQLHIPLPAGVRSRAVAPITEWECPYLYLIGGVDASGTLQPKVWRGVVNHLSFKPLQ